jgi:RNA polymerase sigma-70 factor (ECF subfamily)
MLAETLAMTAAAPAEDTRPEFDALVAAHRPALLGRARQLCRGHLDPEDLVQDTLERAFRRYDSLRDGTRARAWLYTVLTNTFIDRIRQRRAEPATQPIDDVPVAAPVPVERPAWEQIGPAQLHAAVARLPRELEEVYRLHALEGVDYSALTARLGIPKSTVGTRLLRARRLLRELLAAELGGEVTS